MKYKITYHDGMSFCTIAKQFGVTPYEIFRQNNIHNILDLVDGQVLELEVKDGNSNN